MKGSTKPQNSAATTACNKRPSNTMVAANARDHADHDEQDQPAEADGQAGLQHELD